MQVYLVALVVCAVMLLLAVIAVLNVIQSRRRIWTETEVLTELEDGPVNGEGGTSAAWTAADLSEVIRSYDGSCCARELGVGLSSGTFDISRLPVREWIDTSRNIAGLLVFVGLIGTVTGISLGVGSLAGVTSSANGGSQSVQTLGAASAPELRDDRQRNQRTLDAITKQISALMQDMLVACVSTFVGLSLTVLMSLVNAAYFGRCARLEDACRRVWASHVLPAYASLSDSNAAISLLVEAAEDLSAAASASDTSVLQAQLASSARTIEEVSRSVQATFKKSGEALKALSDEGILVSKRLQETHDALKAERDRVLRGTSHLEQLIQKAEALAGQALPGLETAAERLQSVAGTLERDQASITDLSGQLTSGAGKMQTSVIELREALADGMKDQNDALTRLATEVGETHSQLEKALINFSEAVRDATVLADMHPLRHAVTTLSGSVDASTGQVQGVLSEMREGLLDATKKMGDAATKLHEVGGALTPSRGGGNGSRRAADPSDELREAAAQLAQAAGRLDATVYRMAEIQERTPWRRFVSLFRRRER